MDRISRNLLINPEQETVYKLNFFLKISTTNPGCDLSLRASGEHATNLLNPFTPTSDQDRISPYNIKQAGDENREEYQSWDY